MTKSKQSSSIDRKKIIQNFIKDLQKDLEKKAKFLEHTKTATKEAPSAMESASDTTRTTNERLADSQKKLIAQTEKIIKHLEHLEKAELGNDLSAGKAGEVEIGNVVSLESKTGALNYLLVEHGGGLAVKVRGDEIMAVSIESLIGKNLLHKKVGTEIEMLNNKFKIASIN